MNTYISLTSRGIDGDRVLMGVRAVRVADGSGWGVLMGLGC